MMRDAFLPFASPDLDDTELQQIKEALDAGWVTTGPKTRQFEIEFAAAVGAGQAVALNSCTAAMHLALEAVGLQPGDNVITTPYTFAATVEVIRYFDARPVLVDVRSNDLNIDPALVEEAISERTRAIIPVHIGGLPAEMDAIQAVAQKHNLAIVEDAAHAFPSMYKGRMIGQDVGQARDVPHFACFSFYATKTITTGEGGMLCVDDEDLADHCRIMALHGISKDAWKRYTAEGSWYYEIVAPGFKYNMTDVAAAMGLAQLVKADRMWQQRRLIAQRYDAAFKDVAQLQIPYDREDCQHAWQLYMLRLNLDRLRVDRAGFIQALKEHQIGASVHFIPIHLHPYYRETYGYGPEDFPVAFHEYQRELSLPIYSKMTDRDIDDVIAAVIEITTTYRC
jgi:dTDP-4-amino-4,6-dideoxygalactose transaminase